MKPWIYLVNPFLTATKGSYRTAKKLGDFTVAALTAHPGAPFAGMLTALSPLTQTFNDAYAAWTMQRGLQKGKTSGLHNQLKLLSGQKIEDWDISIQQVYKQDTPQYVSLLPNGARLFKEALRKTA